MNIVIAGSRHMPFDGAFDHISGAVEASGFQISTVGCGMARGADTWGMLWATERSIPVKRFHPEWERLGNGAGPIRNQHMAEWCDGLIAFMWGNSRGTMDMYERVRGMRKPYYVLLFNGNDVQIVSNI